MPLTSIGAPGNVVTVPATIADSRHVKLLLDTGAAFSLIAQHVADDLNLPSRPSGIRLFGVTGGRDTPEVRLPSITLGRVRSEGVYFIVDPSDNPLGNPNRYDGILGADILTNADLDLDFANGKANLISPQHCPRMVEYWAAPKLAVVPMHIDYGHHITFPMTLDGHRVNAMLDTGATGTTLNRKMAQTTFNIGTNGSDVEKIGELKGGYTAAIYRHRFKALEVDGIVVENPEIDLLPDMMNVTPEKRPTGSLIRNTEAGLTDLVLGMSVLSKLHVYIAYKESKVYITAASPEAQAGSNAPPTSQP